MSFTQMQRSCVSRMTTQIGRRLGSGSVPASDSTPCTRPPAGEYGLSVAHTTHQVYRPSLLCPLRCDPPAARWSGSFIQAGFPSEPGYGSRPVGSRLGQYCPPVATARSPAPALCVSAAGAD